MSEVIIGAETVLEYLSQLSSEMTYEKICNMTDEQKAKYKVLLDEFEETHIKPSTTKQKGEALEKLVTFLLTVSGGIFIVQQDVRTNTNEIDQVIALTAKGKILMSNGLIDSRLKVFLGECKNYNKKVDVTYIGKLCSLLITTQYRLGILFSYHGVTGKNWSYGSGLIRKFYLHKEDEENRFCIIDFNIDDFKSIATGNNFLQIIRQS